MILEPLKISDVSWQSEGKLPCLESGSFLDTFNICIQIVDLLLDQIEKASLYEVSPTIPPKFRLKEENEFDSVKVDKLKIKPELEISKSTKRSEKDSSDIIR